MGSPCCVELKLKQLNAYSLDVQDHRFRVTSGSGRNLAYDRGNVVSLQTLALTI